MGSTCVVGLQWGDEAKGKAVDLLTDRHDLVVRFNGGANAGHTVAVGENVYKLSLVPSGIVNPRLTCVIANGLAIHPALLIRELDSLISQGLEIDGRLKISERAAVILPYHLEEERLAELAAGGRAIGTTKRGVGPCYADKTARFHSLRMIDLMEPDRLRERLQAILPIKNRLLKAMDPDAKQFDVAELTEEYCGYADRLRPYVCDTFWYLQHAVSERKNLLFEAAQGSLLDVDHGSFPYVTSSNSSACGLANGCGISQRRVDTILGIVKAYSSRVGGGPFPTELHDEIGEHIRKEGNEFGTVTGRPRRCGWLDVVACRYAALFNGVDAIGVMLLDVLGKLDEVAMCVEYEIDGERTKEFPARSDVLERCRPVYRRLPGWKKDLRSCRREADLPKEARAYIDTVSEYLQAPVRICSVGPRREETVLMNGWA